MARNTNMTVDQLRALIDGVPGNLPVLMAHENAYGNDPIIAKVAMGTIEHHGLILHELP